MQSEYHLLHAPNMRDLADSLRVWRVIVPETSTSYPTDDVSVSYVGGTHLCFRNRALGR
ncbi:hypothetical protein BH18ACT13_BH18ACT13_12500 [soil metagenome]